jgi:hypothetical protein
VVQIVEGIWSAPTFTLQGAHFQVAGGGERVTLHQVAQYADVSNMAGTPLAGSAFTPEDVRRKYAVLRRECEAVGRPYESILRTYLHLPVILGETREAVEAKVATMPPPLLALFQPSLLAVTVDEAIAHYHGLAAAGVQYFMATLWGHDLETLRLLAERVIPAVNGAVASVAAAKPRYEDASAPDVAPAPSAITAGAAVQQASAKRRWWPRGR